MAVFETWLKSDLKKPLKVVQLEGNLFSQDNGGNLIGAEVTDGGQAATLSGNVTGYFMRADGETVVITGTLSGNRASIVLPASAYVVVGQASIVIKVGSTTVGACVGYVYRTTTDAIVDPGRVIPSLAELLAQIATMRELNQTVTEQESGRVTAETGRVTAEQGRVSAESARVTAEQGRSTAESARAAAETARATAESGRASAETVRETAETARGTAETARATAETARDTAETARTGAETARASAETARAAAETARASAETARDTAETARAAAESARDAAETQRATDTAAAIAAAEAATGDAEDAADMVENITVAANGLAPGSQPTATVSIVDGHLHIVFGSVKGDPGKDFEIRKTFSSIAEMQAYDPETDPGTRKVRENDFVMIDTGSVQDADTGKLYCYEPTTVDVWRYIGDLSGSQGIKGETGTGIDHVTLNADYTLTVYYDDGTSDTTASIRGATGATPNISIGTVTTLLPNQSAYVQLDQSSTPEAPVFNFGIPQGETGQVENIYGSTVPMSPSDSTKVKEAIDGKLAANQGSANAGKYMKVGPDGTLTPETLDIGSKADKDTDAVVGNFAMFDANGNPVDSGHKHSDYLTQHQDISGKADKVQNATANNFAGLDANGNLKDSGKAASDFVAANQIINNLTTDDATKPLSAAMGKELNSKLFDTVFGAVSDADLQSKLITTASKLQLGEMSSVNFYFTYNSDWIGLNYGVYSGILTRYDANFFAVKITAIDGGSIDIAYNNGAWSINNINQKFNDLSTELAAVENGLAYRETGATASRNISDGEYVFWNGAMYKANGNVASGATLVSGTNLTPTENALNTLNGNLSVIPWFTDMRNTWTNYGTTQKEIGKYTDGSTIYIRRYSGSFEASGNVTVDSRGNIRVLDVYGWIKVNNTENYYIPASKRVEAFRGGMYFGASGEAGSYDFWVIYTLL